MFTVIKILLENNSSWLRPLASVVTIIGFPSIIFGLKKIYNNVAPVERLFLKELYKDKNWQFESNESNGNGGTATYFNKKNIDFQIKITEDFGSVNKSFSDFYKYKEDRKHLFLKEKWVNGCGNHGRYCTVEVVFLYRGKNITKNVLSNQNTTDEGGVIRLFKIVFTRFGKHQGYMTFYFPAIYNIKSLREMSKDIKEFKKNIKKSFDYKLGELISNVEQNEDGGEGKFEEILDGYDFEYFENPPKM